MPIKTVLLDLDNTLLGNDNETFVPAYFKLLARRLAPFIPPRELPQAISASVRAAIANEDPAVSNLDVFYQDFMTRVTGRFEDLLAAVDAFYAEDYPGLRACVEFWPEARPLVRRLLDEGQTVVIATNPLYPATAIEQRLAWAGLGDFAFDLVTTIENSRYAKPHPGYYEDILQQVGAAPETTLMVGDDPDNDLVPARSLGLRTWWVTPAGAGDGPVEADGRGTLADFLAWVETGGLG